MTNHSPSPQTSQQPATPGTRIVIVITTQVGTVRPTGTIMTIVIKITKRHLLDVDMVMQRAVDIHIHTVL